MPRPSTYLRRHRARNPTEGDIDAAREIVEKVEDAELFLYPGISVFGSLVIRERK
ncbi:hypothetical protein GOB19_28840 [Sinorhizobium meliloti]|nr:hypothetical protein [Sinorhizobium meliloti]MDX0376358.1 hypothetical protein [Sinorhizobium meliloti]